MHAEVIRLALALTRLTLKAATHPVWVARLMCAGALLACLLPPDVVAGTGAKVALVIGNGAYREHRLNNPVSDARLMATTLDDAGFDVTQGTDLSQRDMYRLITAFRERAETADIALLYFAGHGVRINGTNYLIPVDLEPRSEYDVTLRAVDLDRVVDLMQGGRGRVNVIVIDACRDNPFGATRSLTAKGGLAEIRSRPGTLVAYSTAPGSTALDSAAPTGQNSIYTYALANAIKIRNLPVEDVFKTVRRDVLRATRGRQVPWEATSLTVPFSLNGSASDTRPGQPLVRATPSPDQPKEASSGRSLDAAGAAPSEDFVFLAPEEARERLARMGVPWSNEAFAAALREGDVLTLNLFLQAGKSVYTMLGREPVLASLPCGEHRARTVRLLKQAGVDLNLVYDRAYRIEGIWTSGKTNLLHAWMSRCANDDEAFAQALVDAGVRWPADVTLARVPREYWDTGMLSARRSTLVLVAGNAIDPAFDNHRLYDTAIRWPWMRGVRRDRQFMTAVAPHDVQVARAMVQAVKQELAVDGASPLVEEQRQALDDEIACTYAPSSTPVSQATCIAHRRKARGQPLD